MAERRDLKYATVKDVIADVERLRHGHRQTGNWTLAQSSWHCATAIERCLHLPVEAGAASTPEQAQLKASRLDKLISGAPIPAGMPMPPGVDPVKDAPGTLDDAAVTRFLELLRQLDSTSQPRVKFAHFGIVSLDEFKRFILIHTAHHMSRFIHTS